LKWNSEGGRVRGVIVKEVISAVRFNGYVHHASRGEPHYIIKSDKTDHVAIHKAQALKQMKSKKRNQAKESKTKGKLTQESRRRLRLRLRHYGTGMLRMR